MNKAFQFLDTEWRRNVWQRWLGNIFLPPVPPHPPEPVSTSPLEERRPQTERPPVADTIAPDAQSLPSEAPGVDPRPKRRARFDALLARLSDIEDTLDALNSRVASRLSHDRRSEGSSAELMESIAETAERQTRAIEALVFSIERIDERLERLERGLLRSSRQPSRRSTPPTEHVEEEQLGRSRITGFFADLDLSNESSMHGSLSDMSLGTVMAMLELERRTGRLRVSSEDGSLACFELREGAVSASRINETDIDPVECLRQVLGWRDGRFWFHQNSDDSPRTVGSLLLEATRQNDEARAEAR
jgi:hypothetical protein